MKNRRIWVCLVAILGCGRAEAQVDWREAARQARALPASIFMSHSEVQMPRLSPDGSKIAFLFPHEDRMALGVFDRDSKDAKMVLEAKDESLVTFFWKGNERIVFAADRHGNESFFIGTTDLSGRRIVRVVETAPSRGIAGSIGGIVDQMRFDEDRIMVGGLIRSASRTNRTSFASSEMLISVDATVAKVNVRNRGISTMYTFDSSDRTNDVYADSQGDIRLRSREETNNGVVELVWEHRPRNDAAWSEFARHLLRGYEEDWQPLFFNRDDLSFYVLCRDEYDRGALYEFNTVTFTRELLFAPPQGEITGAIRSSDGGQLYGVSYEGEDTNYHWFEAGGTRARLQASLEAAFPGMAISLTSASDDEQTYLVFVGSDREAGVYFVLDRKAGTLDQFKRVREINPALMRPMEAISFQARDGLEIHGFLIKPWSSESGKPVPLIINPHGGPFGVRDDWGFDREAQFLASRGYAVLKVNYRGSGGYGTEFLEKGRRQWGRAMQDDLTDAVRWAIDEGIADPDRVGIYGASYGGFATLAGLVFTPELYACGVNYVGATDLDITFKPRGADAFIRADDFDYRDQWVGDSKAYRDESSPINFIDRIRVPTLHAYGRKDPRVEIDHWSRLEAELKRYNKPYESIVEARQGHGFRDVEASTEFYQRMESFLARYLNPSVDLE